MQNLYDKILPSDKSVETLTLFYFWRKANKSCGLILLEGYNKRESFSAKRRKIIMI